MAYTKQKKQENLKYNPPKWLTDALVTLKPPENITVSEWADKNRILDAKTSSEPGQWRTDRTPYLRAIMDSYNDPCIEIITFVKPTQVGGTEALNNIIGYVIANCPSPSMMIYPTIDLAEYSSFNRIQPMIRLCPVIKSKYLKNESKVLELQFINDMYLAFSGANSPASLASKPIKNLFVDERDKQPKFSGKEADPMSLAQERQKTFPYDKKTFETSTPTLKTGPIWKSWEAADVQCRYYVPCPHCGHFQTFKFKGGIKWPESAKTAEERNASAYYECESCKGVITDIHKPQMLRSGDWKDEKNGKWFRDIKENKRKTAFHLNAIYSPWVRFGDVAYQFTISKDFPEKLMNFVNSWLAEPWEQTEVKMNANIILDRQSKYEENIVPEEAIILTGGIDVQKDHFVFTIRAWGAYMTSWNITHGLAQSWNDVENIMGLPYKTASGKEMIVNLAAIDSGDQTDDVYDLIAMNQDWLVPVKGSSRPLLARYKMSMIDRVNSKAHGMRLYIVDGGQYKDMIASRLNRPNGRGSWMVFNGCDLEYAEQICSEEKVPDKNGNFIWQPKTTNAANHYLDAEVYCSLAADLMQVRYLQPEEQEKSEQPNIIQDSQNNSRNDYIKSSDNWIKSDRDWIR